MITAGFEAVRSMKLPDDLTDAGLLVGWSQELSQKKQPIGFSFGNPKLTPEQGWIDPILLDGEGHLITIAPTGSGKGRGCIIPALLRHKGPVIVIDPKGENAAVTARQRRSMGQKVVIIDPMGITGQATDSFNPLDLIDVDTADAVDLATMMAHALVDGSNDPKNRYWYQRAQFLLSAIILHVKSDSDKSKHTFARIRETLELFSMPSSEGSTHRDLLALSKSKHPEMRRAARQLLSSSSNEPNASIISMANDGVDFLKGQLIDASISSTSFSLDDVTLGAPMSIYLVLPPHMLESHGRLLRLWVTTLLSLITRRRGRPEKSTLFILDECAQLGTLPQLRQIITLLRGYGVQSWSFWQDVSQLQNLYATEWKTMLNNCAVVQCFSALNLMAAQSMAEITGFGTGLDILELAYHEMILQIAGDTPVIARKPDYLNDPAFKGLFDENPFHNSQQPIMPQPAPALREGARQHIDPSLLVPLPIDESSEEFSRLRHQSLEQVEQHKAGKYKDQLLERLLDYFEK